MTTFTLSLTPHQAHALLSHAATDDIRTYLNGVNVAPTPRGVCLSATNGSQAVRLWPLTSNDNPENLADRGIILEITDYKKAVKALGALSSRPHLQRMLELVATWSPDTVSDDGTITRGTWSATLNGTTCALVQGTYPEIERVCPANAPTLVTSTEVSGAASFDLDQLRVHRQAAGWLEYGVTAPKKLSSKVQFQHSPTDAYTRALACAYGHNWCAVLMPLNP
jgi:hypothetical protein